MVRTVVGGDFNRDRGANLSFNSDERDERDVRTLRFTGMKGIKGIERMGPSLKRLGAIRGLFL